jgi:hypothetical protein
MKTLLTAVILAFAVPAYPETLPVKPITEQQALEIAKKQLASARPDLDVKDPVPDNRFVPAGPASGGGPKWVIGFETIDRNSGRKWICYVTVFPDGQTSEKEIRPGAMTGNLKND